MKENEYGKNWVDKSTYFIEKNRMLVFCILILVIVIFALLVATISNYDNTTVEVDMPPRGKVIVTNDKANEIYYDIWTEHYTNNTEYYELNSEGEKTPVPFTFSIVDFDYTNVEMKYGEFLKRYKPSKLIKERHLFNNFTKNVKVKMLTQKFKVEDINSILKEDGHKASTIVSGVAFQDFAGVKKEPKECTYTFGYERIGGKIYGTSLQTTCFN